MDFPGSAKIWPAGRCNPGTEGLGADGDTGDLSCLRLTVARSRYSRGHAYTERRSATFTCVILKVLKVRVHCADDRETRVVLMMVRPWRTGSRKAHGVVPSGHPRQNRRYLLTSQPRHGRFIGLSLETFDSTRRQTDHSDGN